MTGRSTNGRRSGRAAGVLAVGSVLVLASIVPSSAATGDWPGYLFGARHGSRNAGATAITPANASTLSVDWTFTADPPTQPDQPSNAFIASPTVADGRVYIGSNTGIFYELDEADGSVVHSADLGYVPALSCTARGIASTATVAFDSALGASVVYVAGGDGFLYALRADDLTQVWRSRVVQTGATANTGYNWASPIVVGGHVYMGVSSLCDRPLVRGGLKEYDQATGALVHTYRTVPRGSIGGSVWTSPASRGRDVWITTGNANAGDRPGDSFAMVRLDASTVQKRERWVVPGARQDLDWGSSPTLFSARIGGRRRDLVGACSKNGRYYALRARNLANGPVWSRRLGQRAGLTGGTCLAAAIWDEGDGMLVTGSSQTTISGTTYPAAVRALNPSDGSILWTTTLAEGPVMGSPTMNGAGVIAAGTYHPSDPASNAVYLLDASDGQVVRTIDVGNAVFAQPVFAGSHLYVASWGGVLTAYS
jgi:polyvinyl alcohol dehydrogenase (cytochrome)